MCTIFIIVAQTIFASSISAQPLRKALPTPDSSGQNYYAVDSDDPVTDPLWKPAYKFLDTTYQPSTWHRIYPGALSVPAANPQGVFWRGIDSTDNTFAGPIRIGFPFNFYGVDYDSCYLSSNGFIGFGNFNRASGGDGPSFAMNTAAGGNGCLPSTTLPKAIAAFLMTDGEMVRSVYDSSRAFYRTNFTNDSFFISFYNFYHKTDASTGSFIHKIRADIQIVFTSKDSAITFHYRKFNGSLVIGLTSYSAENVFRIGCVPDPCLSNAGVIGIQSDSQIGGTSYMCAGQFTSKGSVSDLHSGLAVRFKRWKNICKADSIIWPPRNYELIMGDSVTPVAVFRNVSPVPQSFYCYFRIRSVRTGQFVYSDRDSVVNLPAGASQRITFPPMIPPGFSYDVGAFRTEAIASPFNHDSVFIGDSWPFDDTLRQQMFWIRRLDNFTDFNNNFSSGKLINGAIPDALMWENINAEVVDGDLNTYSPPPPRGKQGDPNGLQLNSPVIKMDRLDANGLEYDHCAFGGINPSGDNTIGDGGTGDTIISFPIDLSSKKNAVLGFSYERSGKKDYPRWYDLGTAVGPERTVTQPDLQQVYRAGDSLEVEFASPLQRTNVTSWKEFWSADGGKDFNFNRVWIPIDSTYCTQNFRFRVRLKAKNDFEPGNPSDDYDEWYLDNFVVTQDSAPEIEVSYARIGPDWPYEKMPGSQAVAVPVEVKISNNGGAAATGFGVAVIIVVKGFMPSPPYPPYYGVYAKLITIPVLAPHTSQVLAAPKWNARQAGPGQYELSAFLLPKGYDAEGSNDSTYYDFAMLFDSSIVYDKGVNDAPGFFQLPGIGLHMPETNPAYPLGSPSWDNGNGTIATKLIFYQRDTLVGAQLWFGSRSQSPDAIRIVVYKSQGSVPGDTISGGCATFTSVRSAPWDGWSLYNFPCGPIVLDPGEYWMGVSQLGETGMSLGVSANKSSCDWTVYDPTPNRNHILVVNYPDMINRFAYEDIALSNSWYPFYFPAGTGLAGFSYPESNSAYSKTSIDCGRPYNYFNAQGSWIPLIRPYFGNKSFGPPPPDCKHRGQPTIEKTAESFGTLISCIAADTSRVDSIKVINDFWLYENSYG